MATDRRFIDIHHPMLSIGAAGNLLLETTKRLAVQEQQGNIPHLMGTGLPSEFTIAAAAGAANVCNVTFTLVDLAPAAVLTPLLFDIWLSDAATGAGLTATTATGGIAAVTGVIWSVQTASKALRVQANASGVFTLAITDTAKTTFFPAAQNPASGLVTVGTRLVTANYG